MILFKRLYCKYWRRAHAVDFGIYEASRDGQKPCCICGEPIRSLRMFYFKSAK